MSESRSPDAIQREIEATRAELAETIDAIADRVSPKKAASRSAHAVKAKASAALGQAEKAVSEVAGKVGEVAGANGSDAQHEPPISATLTREADSGHLEPSSPTVLDLAGTTVVNGRPAAVLDATPEQAAHTDQRRVAQLQQAALRTDRVMLSVGVAAAAVGVVVLLRSRRH